MKKNDEKILKLKEQIKSKKEQLKRNKRFNPKTNCVFNLFGQNWNLNVIKEDKLTDLLVLVNLFKMSVEDLKLEDFDICGFPINDWISDIKSKIFILNINKEKALLKDLEEKLNSLLSNEKRVELELDEIENLIK